MNEMKKEERRKKRERERERNREREGRGYPGQRWLAVCWQCLGSDKR